MRQHTLSIVCLLAAALIGIAAIVDHADKQRRINRVERARWYCEHSKIGCTVPDPDVIERRWNERQIAYEVAVIALGGFAVVRFAFRARRR